MPNLPETLEFPLLLRVPRSVFTMVAPEPATVTQHTAEQHFGIPARKFKEMVRDGLLPSKRIGRLIFATYEDVKRVVTEGAVARSRVDKEVAQAIAEPEAPMSLDAAEAYLDGALTPREKRERRKEISLKSTELTTRYGPTLNDGSPNPEYNKALYEHGMSLLLSSVGLRRRKPEDPAAKGAMSCCWCSTPAYATKQTWEADKGYWGGGPVCEACARRRKPNERVVDFQARRILLPAADPAVPKTWDAPRRRRPRS